VALTADTLWAATWNNLTGGNTLLRIDLATRAVVATISTSEQGDAGFAFAVDAKAAWLPSRFGGGGGGLERVDVRTNHVVDTLTLPNIPFTVVFAAGAVWVTSFEQSVEGFGDTVWRITPAP
jgi:hypothetical protein